MLVVVARFARDPPRYIHNVWGPPGRLTDAHTAENTTEGCPNRRHRFPLSSTAPRKGRYASNMQPGNGGHGYAAPNRDRSRMPHRPTWGIRHASRHASHAAMHAPLFRLPSRKEQTDWVPAQEADTIRRTCPGKLLRRGARRAPRRGGGAFASPFNNNNHRTL